MTESTLSNNTASGDGSLNGQGGGISNLGNFTLTRSTLFGNTAISTNGESFGGGIYSRDTLTLTNSTLFNNTASSTNGQSVGGGIVNSTTGTLTMSYNTLFGNMALSTNNTSFGGGIDNYGEKLTLSLNIIAANKAQQGSDIEDGPGMAGSLASSGYNLIQDSAGLNGLSATDRQVTLSDLKLDPTLGNHGGPTQTLALLPGSVAIDAVPLEICHSTLADASGSPMTITTDQRGVSRPSGSKNMCDIGAYEA
jgi:hypothetical protein